MDNDEICGTCVLSNMCKANTKTANDCISPSLKKKAITLVFWIPLIIISCSMFITIALLHIEELLSFAITMALTSTYYLILKYKIKDINK